jgi:peptidoglycan lytic transglycosylase G
MNKIKIIAGTIIGFIIIGLIFGLSLYKKINQANVKFDGDEIVFYIPSGSSYNDLLNQIIELDILIDTSSFNWVAKKKNLQNRIIPGKYIIKNGLSNNQLVNLFRSGSEVEVKVVFNNIRTRELLAGRIAEQLELDSLSLLDLLYDETYIESLGFSSETIISLFIPNTYRFFWDTDAKGFVNRMKNEYDRFWNKNRLKKAEKVGLTPVEVMILASIVEEETKKNDEKERLAGVYLNRLRKGWRLQADPTVIFALGDFSVNRVLLKHLEIDSPYNTYKYKGLPPGPINIPSISSIDAVLNAEKHSYLYFCAKEDFSGYHYFSKTLKQHNVYADKYKRALNKRRIYR